MNRDMISKEIIQKILESGAQAPSGSNSQPWRFVVTGDRIAIYMIPERDHAILNFRNRGTLLAHGALIENMVIAAGHYGVGSAVDLFPEKNDQNFVARVTLKENGGIDRKELFDAIGKRATNRKPYESRSVDENIRQRFIAIPAEIREYNTLLRVADDRDEIGVLARAASANEQVMFEDKALHRLFFEELVWSEAEERERKSGLYLKTMELAPPQALALRAFKWWPVMKFLGYLGAARGIAKGNAKGYAACAFYGAILCDSEDKAFVGAGRVIERAWLLATALGLSFHLQTGVNFLWQRIEGDAHTIFSPRHIGIIREEYKTIADVFKAEGRFVPALFRVGYDGEPSARSSRKAPEVLFN